MENTPTETLSAIHPKVFSRGAIEMTFTLLREKFPSAALQVRNVLSEPAIEAENLSPEVEHFNVSLPAKVVEDVIIAITSLSSEAVEEDILDPGRLIVLKSLLQEWVNLAEYLISD